VMAFREIENLMPMKEPADKTRMFQTFLKCQALSYFEQHLMRRLEAEDSGAPDNYVIKLGLRDVGLEYIPKRAIRVQKYYMRQSRDLYMCLNISVQQFVERLNDLNHYLLYFPEENPKQLDQDEIIEILDQAKAVDPEWHEAMVNANIDIFEMSYEESASYFKRLENLEKIRPTNGPSPTSLSVDNKKGVSLPVVQASLLIIIRGPTCGVTIVTRTTTTRLIAEQFPNLNSRKRTMLALKPKMDPERSDFTFRRN
jgi:hypothetical protein